MIKNLIVGVAAVLTVLTTDHVTAQPFSTDISAGAGLISLYQISTALAGGSDRDPIQIGHASPILFVSGKYFLKKKVAVGVTIATQHITGQSNYDWALSTSHSQFTYKMNVLIIAPEVTVAYLRKRFVMLYTTLGIGYDHYFITYDYQSGYNDYKMNANNIDWQYTPFGIKTGRTFSGFLEFGVGFKGLINGGITYSLGKAAR